VLDRERIAVVSEVKTALYDIDLRIDCIDQCGAPRCSFTAGRSHLIAAVLGRGPAPEDWGTPAPGA
jgi:hypothetical protein